jgi:hypothetical protein
MQGTGLVGGSSSGCNAEDTWRAAARKVHNMCGVVYLAACLTGGDEREPEGRGLRATRMII